LARRLAHRSQIGGSDLADQHFLGVAGGLAEIDSGFEASLVGPVFVVVDFDVASGQAVLKNVLPGIRFLHRSAPPDFRFAWRGEILLAGHVR